MALKINVKTDTRKAKKDFKGLGNSVKDGAKKGSKSVEKLNSRLKKAAASAKALSSRFGGLASIIGAGALAASMKALIGQTREYGDKLHKLNLRLNISVETLDKLKHVADLSGVSFTSLTTALSIMSKNLDMARKGTGDAADAYREIGLSVDALLKLNPEEQFLTIAEAISKVKNTTIRNATAMKLLGRSATELMSMLPGLREQLEKTEATMTDGMAKSVADFNDNLTTLTRNMKSSFLPVLTDAMGLFNKAFETTGSEMGLLKRRLEANDALIAAGLKTNDILKERERILGQIRGLERVGGEDFDAIDAAASTTITTAGVAGPKGSLGMGSFGGGQGVAAGKDATRSDYKRFMAEKKKLRNIELTNLKDNLDREVQLEKDKNMRLYEAGLDLAAKQEEIAAKRAAANERVNRMFTDTATNGIMSLIEGTKSWGQTFKDSIRSALSGLSRLILQTQIYNAIKSSSIGASLLGSADGNVLKGGFQAFASGGVVKKPTLGLIGEGKQNEAVVPLPDGRNIPVNMKGDGAKSVVINAPITMQYQGEEDAAAAEVQTQQISRQLKVLVRMGIQEELSSRGALARGLA